MTILTRTSDSSFTGGSVPLTPVRLPFASDCLGYYMLGVDDASSRLNRMVSGADLVAVGGGATGFGPNWARLYGSAGYRTPFTVTPGAYSAFAICDRPSANADGTGNAPYYFNVPASPIGSQAGYGGPRQYGYTAQDSGGVKNVTAVPTNPATTGPFVTADRGIGYDPNNVYPPRGDYGGGSNGLQALSCIVENPLSIDMHIEEGRAIRSFLGANAAGTPSTTPFQLWFPWNVAGGYFRFSAIAVYNRSMTPSEVRSVYQVMRAHNEARGWRD